MSSTDTVRLPSAGRVRSALTGLQLRFHRGYGYAVVGVLTTAVDLVAPDVDNPLSIALDLVILIACYLLPRYPRGSGLLLVLVLTGSYASPWVATCGVFTCFSVLTEWSARGWLWAACGAAALEVATASVAAIESSYAEGAGTLIIGVVAILVGLALRSHQQARETFTLRELLLEEQLASARQAATAALTVELHDTCATSLSKALIQTRLLQAHARGTALEDEVGGVVTLTQDALAQLRQVIHAARRMSATRDGALPGPLVLDEEISAAREALATRRISLTVSGAPAGTWAEALPAVLARLACLAVREGTINILKFAPHGSTATIELTLGEDMLMLTLYSQLATPTTSMAHDDPCLSGGFGIAGLTMRAAQLGGSVSAGANGDQWRLALVLPRESEDS